jgi:transposase
MAVVVGVDIAKEFHWVAAVITETGKVIVSRRVDNDPGSITDFLDQLTAQCAGHEVTLGIDLMGGIANLFAVMVQQTPFRLVHVPGLVVNRARNATRGGEHKSDPRDARTIADQLRLRDDWRVVTADDPQTLDLRLLVSRRRELVVDQTRTMNRLREMLGSYFPGLELIIESNRLCHLYFLTRYATPREVRRAGRNRIISYLQGQGVRATYAERMADRALTAAQAHRIDMPGETRMAEFVREFAAVLLAHRERLASIDTEIESALEAHPDAALVRSLPGMGATLTAEFLAEAGDLTRFANGNALAAAAGLAPILQQSGKVSYLRRATGGTKNLKYIFYQSAFCALQRDPVSMAFYKRKRAEGKRHQQALIALARRRVNVLHALLRTRQPYRTGPQPVETATAA